MASRNERPLLTNDRTQSPDSTGQGMEEEDALLTGQRTTTTSTPTHSTLRSRWKEIALFAWALLATAGVVILAVLYEHHTTTTAPPTPSKGTHNGGKRNLIFMVSDGMGPTSLSLTRSYKQHTQHLDPASTLVLDKHLIGQSRTRSSSSLVTDSAAGATAFSCGQKSYNGAISVLPNYELCGSVMEAAKRMGYTTGLVVTTRITDATPAVFVSHVRRREMEDEIALQMVGETHPMGRMVDLMFGGGRCHFLPGGREGGCRNDSRDVLEVAGRELGWGYVGSRKEFDRLGSGVELPLLGLFADGDIPYEIDRVYEEEKYPSLEEMTRKALRILSAATQDSEKGFFVMIEGSRIDHAGHGNDAAAQVHEVLAYDKAMAAVLEFIEDTDTPTLMVSTSDHETGGLAVARQLHETYPDYLWYPGVLANASHSASWAAHQYHDHLEANGRKEDIAFLEQLINKQLGIGDATKDELDLLLNKDKQMYYAYYFADMVSRRAQTGWSTHGHSGADVNIYSSDPEAAADLVGQHENTDVGAFLRSYLDLDDEVAKVSKELKKHMHVADVESWLGSVPATGERLDGQNHIDHYHGDHRRRGCDVCRL